MLKKYYFISFLPIKFSSSCSTTLGRGSCPEVWLTYQEQIIKENWLFLPSSSWNSGILCPPSPCPLLCMIEFLSGLSLHMSCACFHNHLELIYTHTVLSGKLCSLKSFSTSSSYNLFTLIPRSFMSFREKDVVDTSHLGLSSLQSLILWLMTVEVAVSLVIYCKKLLWIGKSDASDPGNSSESLGDVLILCSLSRILLGSLSSRTCDLPSHRILPC